MISTRLDLGATKGLVTKYKLYRRHQKSNYVSVNF